MNKDENYWSEREKNIFKFWGKGKLIIEISEIISNQDVSVLELGCGEGHIIGQLQKTNPLAHFYGIDCNEAAICKASIRYPKISFDNVLLQNFVNEKKQKFDVIICSNVFHEVYSDMSHTGNIIEAKEYVRHFIIRCFQLLNPNGVMVILDGIESDISGQSDVSFTFRNDQTKEKYKTFISTYRFLERNYPLEPINNKTRMSYRDFVRFITKLRFINGDNWGIEKEESYQYFNLAEFTEVFEQNGLQIFKLEQFISNLTDWENSICPLDERFPYEHIIIMAKKRGEY